MKTEIRIRNIEYERNKKNEYFVTETQVQMN